MHMLGAPSHLLTRLDDGESREITGRLALSARDDRLGPRLFGLLMSDRCLSADMTGLTAGLFALLTGGDGVRAGFRGLPAGLGALLTRFGGLDASLASDLARRLGLGPLLRRAVL